MTHDYDALSPVITNETPNSEIGHVLSPIFTKRFAMRYSKKELLTLPLEERKELASDLIDSILADDMQPVAEWKRALIEERINQDDTNPSNGVEWSELRKKYFLK